MKSIIVLLLTFVCIAFAEKVINITIPGQQTVWNFGQIEEVDWVTEATGDEKLSLYYFEGEPSQCNKKPFMQITVPQVEAGKVFFDLRLDQNNGLVEVLKELPQSSKKYFLRFGESKIHGYSSSFTINGGQLTEQDVLNAKNKNSSSASSFTYTALIAIVIGFITTLVNVL